MGEGIKKAKFIFANPLSGRSTLFRFRLSFSNLHTEKVGMSAGGSSGEYQFVLENLVHQQPIAFNMALAKVAQIAA